MDETRFDDLTRALGGASTRRAGLKAALGGLLGLGLAALPAGEAGAKKHKKKRNALCPGVCPSGSACIDGACTCTRELCGGECCAGNQTCQDGRCVTTGLRDCGGVPIVDGADLSYCNLPGAKIPNRTLRNANFEGANLSGAKFTGKFQPWGCSFRNATLANAELIECDIKPGTSFVEADLHGVNIGGSHIDGADFSFAILTKVTTLGGTWSLPGLEISNSRFVQADLTAGLFAKVRIHDSDLTNAIFADTKFADCDINGSDLSGAVFNKAFLKGVRFTDSALDGILLDGAEFMYDGAGTSHIYPTVFRRCSMVNAWMRNQNANEDWNVSNRPTLWFKYVDLSHAKFSGSYPRIEVSWWSVNLTGADGWRQPDGGYATLCDVTLPDGSKAPDTAGCR